VENEAVVAAALLACRGAAALTDPSEAAAAAAAGGGGLGPGLKWAPGLRRWRVPDRSAAGVLYAAWDDVPLGGAAARAARRAAAAVGTEAAGADAAAAAANPPLSAPLPPATAAAEAGPSGEEEARRGLTRSMFPPSAEEAEALGLERCMRVYPHLQARAPCPLRILKARTPCIGIVRRVLSNQVSSIPDPAVRHRTRTKASPHSPLPLPSISRFAVAPLALAVCLVL
jgi:hypothetical protein